MNSLPSPGIMYRALVQRDSTFEGIFLVGVRTTGIFCRPTCPARKPKSENIEYFSTPREAISAGYRPCARCRPLELDRRMPEMIGQLCDAVEKAPNRRMTGTMLKAMGIDPSTARRQFQRHFGMTFQAYCRLRRMGQALQQIQEGDSVIGTQIDTGFASASGFWEAFKQVFGSPPSRAGQVACLFARWIDTPLGAMIALADDAGVHLIEFADRRGLKREIIALRRRLRCVVVPGENVHLKTIAAELGRYFGGSAVTFETPLVVSGSPFELAVWAYLRKITPGDTRSYADLARLVGKPGASRAVGRANGRNRLALVIPCHRVIRADGTMCGYGGGIWRKRWLLQHERKIGRGTAKCSSFSTTMVKP